MVILDLTYFTLAGILLIVSGVYLVKSLTKIAEFLRMSEFTVAFIIMAFATSLPELFVGISSAVSKTPALSLGNVIGASLLNITLIVGIITLLSTKIEVSKKRTEEDIGFMILTILALIGLYLIGRSLSRVDGVILLCLFLINIQRKLKRREKYSSKIEDRVKRTTAVLSVFIFVFALVGLFISSRFLVKYGVNIASAFNFPNILIGLFLLSIATTLPELVFGISATRLEHKKMALGNTVGSVIVNITLVLGIVSIIHPIQTDFTHFLTASIFLFISSFIFFAFAKSSKKIDKIEGISLIFLYILFIIIEFFIRPTS